MALIDDLPAAHDHRGAKARYHVNLHSHTDGLRSCHFGKSVPTGRLKMKIEDQDFEMNGKNAGKKMWSTPKVVVSSAKDSKSNANLHSETTFPSDYPS